MSRELYKKLISILDKELVAYENMRLLFEEKRDILKKAKSGELVEVDSRIISQSQLIGKLNKTRESISEELLGKNGCMTDFIEKATEDFPEFADALTERKNIISEKVEKLLALNNQNVELMKHGIVITNKMLETIIDAFAPQGSIYDGTGKTTDNKDLNMWTVNEEI